MKTKILLSVIVASVLIGLLAVVALTVGSDDTQAQLIDENDTHEIMEIPDDLEIIQQTNETMTFKSGG